MKNVILALILALFAAVGVQVVSVQNTEAAGVFKQSLTADGAVGSATNSNTTILKFTATCAKGPVNAGNNITTAACGFGFRKYASVSTGPILDDDVYFVSVSAGTHTFDALTWGGQVRNNFPNGVYFDALTGTTYIHIYGLK